MKSINALIQKFIIILKTIFRKPIWLLLDIYEKTPISSKYRALKRFDDAAGKNKLFFTNSIFRNGFTDQLFAMKFFRRLGDSINMNYHFVQMKSKRSHQESMLKYSATVLKGKKNKVNIAGYTNQESYSDIYDFLGVNEYLKNSVNKQPGNNCHEITFNLDEIELSNRMIRSWDFFTSEIKFRLDSMIDYSRDNMINLKGLDTVFKLFRLSETSNTPEIPFRKIYDLNRVLKPRENLHKTTGIKLLVHIRQGDTAILKTPWDTYIQSWYKAKDRFIEHATFETADTFENIPVSQFYRFLKDFFDVYESFKFSTLVFSDGFSRAFHEIYRVNKFLYTKEKMHKLIENEKNYNNIEFNDFITWQEVTTVIGEENEKLYDFIHSFMVSDIVVTGTQQKMIPKLIRLFCTPDNMPFMITLYREKEPFVDYLGIESEHKFRLNVNIDNYDMNEIKNVIQVYFEERNLK